jgi:ribonuclease D
MSTEIRTFQIPEDDRETAQTELASFLRTVEVERIDTAYANGGWRILVLYQDLRRKEESAQIEAAILDALNLWRDRTAAEQGIARESVLPDDLLAEISRFAPTTERELGVIIGSRELEIGPLGAEVVHVVRSTLEDLID